MISNDTELENVATKAGKLLQEIQNYLGSDTKPKGKVRFPRGYLRTAAELRKKFWFINDQIALKNISYNLMFIDVLRWLGNRTDIYGTARKMMLKQGLVLFGSLIETICIKCTEGIIGKNKKFKERTKQMVANGMITKQLERDLNLVWDKRSNVHIYLVSLNEHEHYNSDVFNKAKSALDDLRNQMDKYFLNQSMPLTR